MIGNATARWYNNSKFVSDILFKVEDRSIGKVINTIIAMFIICHLVFIIFMVQYVELPIRFMIFKGSFRDKMEYWNKSFKDSANSLYGKVVFG